MIGAKAVRRALERRGVHVVPEWRMNGLPLARHLKALFERYRVDCVFDVGANQGQYSGLLRELGFEGHIVSFEPVAKYAAMLRTKAAGDPKWRVYPFALGSQRGNASINVTVSPGLNSFLAPMVDNGYWTPSPVSGVEEVAIETLDDVYPTIRRELGFESPYLKMDTQGFDLEVMRGGASVLSRFRALQTEASVTPMYENMPGFRDVLDFVLARGFSLSGMFPVSVDEAMRLIEFDCVCVRADS